MANLDKFFHWIWGDNNIRPDNPNYLINIKEGISIRFDYSDSYFADYDQFFNGIADVQFFFGKRPNKNEVERILTDAYNFLCIEERILENDLNSIENELDDFEF